MNTLTPPFNVDPTTKNQYLTYTLWFLFGFAGVHSFYLKDWWRGAVYLLDFALLIHVLWLAFSTVIGMARGTLILPVVTWENATPYLIYIAITLIIHAIVTVMWVLDGVRITRHINPAFASATN